LHYIYENCRVVGGFAVGGWAGISAKFAVWRSRQIVWLAAVMPDKMSGGRRPFGSLVWIINELAAG
jgi:hypothetical protein